LQHQVNSNQIKAQALPALDCGKPDADLLYGYDVVDIDVDVSNRIQRLIGGMEKFKPDIHASPDEKAGLNTSQNQNSRKAGRLERSTEPIEQTNPSLPIKKETIGAMIARELKENKMTSARAQEFLQKMEEFGISCDDSNKWRKRCEKLRNKS